MTPRTAPRATMCKPPGLWCAGKAETFISLEIKPSSYPISVQLLSNSDTLAIASNGEGKTICLGATHLQDEPALNFSGSLNKWISFYRNTPLKYPSKRLILGRTSPVKTYVLYYNHLVLCSSVTED